MRFYKNWEAAVNEITRDLAEMGTVVHPQTMQDKFVGDDPDYETRELQDYIYRVLNPTQSLHQLPLVTKEWAEKEFEERISGYPHNPGDSYLLRPDVWNEFLRDGRFAYSYPERMYYQTKEIIAELKKHPDSRQLFLSVWNPGIDISRLGSDRRVPCSLGYRFSLRDGKLNMTYFMRSCDIMTHFQNDVYLATKLLQYVADEVGVPVGHLTHYVGSFHVYAKDVKGVF